MKKIFSVANNRLRNILN